MIGRVEGFIAANVLHAALTQKPPPSIGAVFQTILLGKPHQCWGIAWNPPKPNPLSFPRKRDSISRPALMLLIATMSHPLLETHRPEQASQQETEAIRQFPMASEAPITAQQRE
jgi:hypothetical protein